MHTMSDLSGPALLFCPADRPERFAKAVAAADLVILDLEDAVAAENKGVARAAILAAGLSPEHVIVRINDVRSAHFEADLVMLRRSGLTTVMLAKTESAADLDEIADWNVVALCETPRAILNLIEIAAHPAVTALMFGAEDFVAELGGRSSRLDGGGFRPAVEHARSALLIAAAACERATVDAVFTDVGDEAGLLAEAVGAAGSGFTHKACIHPSQIPLVRQGFRPSEKDLNWARRVVQSATASSVHTLDGKMIDRPVIAQARRMLRYAGE